MEPSQAQNVSAEAQLNVPTLGQIIDVLERLYPLRLAEKWDAVGLVCGDRQDPVHTIRFAVDPTLDVVDEAIDAGAQLLVTHHPLLLKGVHGVSTDSFKGAVVHRLIKAGCALYVAHTNADSARPGVSDALARIVGLDNLTPLSRANPPAQLAKVCVFVPHDHEVAVIDALSHAGAGQIGQYARCAWGSTGTGTFTPLPGADPAIGQVGQRTDVSETKIEMVFPPALTGAVVQALRAAHPYEEPAFDLLTLLGEPSHLGLGRVGFLPEPTTLENFATTVAKALPYTVSGVRVAGDPKAEVHKIAVCGGAGDSLFDAVRASGADAYLTSDLRHHPASEAREAAGDGPPYLVDVPHWAGEWPWLHSCASRLSTDLLTDGFAITTEVSTLRSDPWSFRVPSSGGFVR